MARIGTSNVAKELGPKNVNACGQVANEYTDMCVFQEVYDEDLIPLQNGLGRRWTVVDTSNECKIGFDHTFARQCDQAELPPGFTPTGTHQLSPGDSSIPNPPRFYSWWFFTILARPNMNPVCLISSHFTNGAFNNRHPETRDIRLERWNNEYAGLNDFVKSLTDAGITAIFGGDYNNTGFDPFGDPGRWLVTNPPYDAIGTREGNVDVTYVSKAVHGNASDHDLLVVKVEFGNQ